MEDNNFISEEEKDILQEIMNIAFGKAAADLAEVINIFVKLNVPYIEIVKGDALPEYLRNQIIEFENITIIEQKFWGEFKGCAFLIFQSSAGKELLSFFGDIEKQDYGSESTDTLEKETLMEIGNILISACVGKLAELLKDTITYSPPRVMIENTPRNAISSNLIDSQSSVIILKTVFSFKERNVNGFLFLISGNESTIWLKKSLKSFMEQYE